MRVLVLAPHPYFVVRGTPIDLDLVLRVLSEREGTTVDVVVYPAGEDRSYPGVRVHRAAGARLARSLPPGFTLRKLLLDLAVAWTAWRLLRSHEYDLIHADEEAVFLAKLFRRLYGVPYAYDLDSSVAQQMVEKNPWMRPLQGVFDRFEASAIRSALCTLPVCDALAEVCEQRRARKVFPIYDISQLSNPDAEQSGKLRHDLGIEGLIVLYAGNLEAYQGVDLLIEGLARTRVEGEEPHVVIVGGGPEEIQRYQTRVKQLQLAGRVHFLGTQPLERLEWFLAEADILASPRVRGVNTPQKVFPYLHSGRPLLATRLPTHTQILTPEIAHLVEPTAEGIQRGLQELAASPRLRKSLGERGRAFVEANHTYPAHRRRLNRAYDWIEEQLQGNRSAA